jgi:lysophospholipase L1-like esterase
MKILFGIAVFLAIIGGWIVYSANDPRKELLPDDHPKPTNCMLWFVGSSSIHRWDTMSRDMAPWVVHNRGIEGAVFEDIIPRFEKIQPSEGRPTAIILYAGENDIAVGADVSTVVRQLTQFMVVRDRVMKDVPLFVLSAKPSPGRWHYFAQQRLYNDEIQKLMPRFRNVHYVDITTPLLVDGKLGANYQPDNIHMNASGYLIWAKALHQQLKTVLPRPVTNKCGRRG